MTPIRSPFRPALLRTLCLCLALGGTGCGLFGDDETDPETLPEVQAEPEPEGPTFACPQPGFPQYLDRIAVFAPGRARYLEDLVTAARFTNVEGECGLEDDGRLLVEFELTVVAVKGPALDPDTDEVTYPYFVALIDPQGTIRLREEGIVEIEFSDDAINAPNDNSLDHEIYISDVDNAGSYQVLAGFILTRDELAYNRRDIRSNRPTVDLFRR